MLRIFWKMTISEFQRAFWDSNNDEVSTLPLIWSTADGWGCDIKREFLSIETAGVVVIVVAVLGITAAIAAVHWKRRNCCKRRGKSFISNKYLFDLSKVKSQDAFQMAPYSLWGLVKSSALYR